MAAMLLGSVLVAVIGAWLLWEWPGMLLVGGVLTADILTRLDVL